MIVEQLIFYTLFFGFFIFFIGIHIVYPFWVHMPITHVYDLHHRFVEPRIIFQLPKKNKYVDLQQCKTTGFTDLTEADINDMVYLLASNYIPADSILFAIEPQHCHVYFSGQNTQITMYKNAVLNKHFGHLCSVPVKIYSNNKDFIVKDIHYCVFHVGTNKDVKEKVLGTHLYKLGGQALLYKKHIGKCAGVVPFARFYTMLTFVGLQNRSNALLQPEQIYRANWSKLYDVMDMVRASFPCVVALDPASIKTRVDAELMMIFTVGTSAYFFEDALLLHEQFGEYGGKTLRLTASMKNGLDNAVFIEGFYNCLHLLQKRNRDYVMCMMDNTGHNGIIMNNMNTNKVIKKTDGMYVLLNHTIKKTLEIGEFFVLG